MTTINGILLETIHDKTDLGTGIAYDDEVAVWDVSAGNTRRVSRTNFLGAALADGTISGGGVVATGGFTLTVPATGTAALLEAANTFTQNMVISKASPGLILIPTSGVAQAVFGSTADDNGAAIGNSVLIRRNVNATTPAAGLIYLQNRGGTSYRIWTDAAGNMRIGTLDPTSANDTTGVVIGTQTSSLDTKDVTEGLTGIEDVLAAVAAGAEAVRRFQYKPSYGGVGEDGQPLPGDRPFNGEFFEGVVVDFAPHYGMDADKEHPAGRSLNTINAIGDLLRAVDYLAQRVAALEAGR